MPTIGPIGFPPWPATRWCGTTGRSWRISAESRGRLPKRATISARARRSRSRSLSSTTAAATVSCDCAWSVDFPCRKAAEPPSRRRPAISTWSPLKISLPVGSQARRLHAAAFGEVQPGGSQEDTFTINVLAVEPAGTPGGKMAIFDRWGRQPGCSRRRGCMATRRRPMRI